MKTLTILTALVIASAGLAEAQNGGSPGNSNTRRPNSSNFGWQDRQQEADEAQEKYRAELAAMSEDDWKNAALAMLSFESNDSGLSLHDVTRIGGAMADRKAKSRSAEGATEEAPAWVVEFGRKKPKVVTLTLTDRNRTEVQCSADQLYEAGGGYIGIFQTEYELLCVARPSGSS